MPADLYFNKEADATLRALEADPAQQKLADRINETLDLLATDPGDKRVRRRQYQSSLFLGGMWGVLARGNDEDWLILWRSHPEEPAAVVIHYIGPDI